MACSTGRSLSIVNQEVLASILTFGGAWFFSVSSNSGVVPLVTKTARIVWVLVLVISSRTPSKKINANVFILSNKVARAPLNSDFSLGAFSVFLSMNRLLNTHASSSIAPRSIHKTNGMPAGVLTVYGPIWANCQLIAPPVAA